MTTTVLTDLPSAILSNARGSKGTKVAAAAKKFIAHFQAAGSEGRGAIFAALKAVNDLLIQGETRALITGAGGIFIGKEELVKLGELSADAVLPGIPEKYSRAFLESEHPLRKNKIASHIILGFDPKTKKWYMVDRGEGGESDIVPGSLGKDGMGLSGDKQDRLLRKNGKPIKVQGVKISTPKDSLPIGRVLNNALKIHLAAGNPIETAPFYDIWGRTGDTKNTGDTRNPARYRCLLGGSTAEQGVRGALCRSRLVSHVVGLLAVWK